MFTRNPLQQLQGHSRKRKFADINEKCQHYQKESYGLRRKLKRIEGENKSLKQKTEDAYKKFLLQEDAQTKLNFLLKDDILGHLNQTSLKKDKKYRSDLRKFALTLHFYSPKEC